MTLRSAIYLGHVRHRRREPATSFRFPLFMAYLDLAELDDVFSRTRLWGRSRWSPAQFRRSDFLAPHDVPLHEAVRRLVGERLGRRPSGPVRVLTHLRYFGHSFNPVTFYYCFDESERVTAIVAEITNTPWRERHAYVLDVARLPQRSAARPMRWRFGKDFYVSPFLPPELEYDWTLREPGERLFVHMIVRDRRPATPTVFDATLRMQRRELTAWRLRLLLLRYPLMTVQIISRIYLEALKLWIRRAPVYPHAPEAPRTPVRTSSSGDPL